jgi:hypothetical protein
VRMGWRRDGLGAREQRGEEEKWEDTEMGHDGRRAEVWLRADAARPLKGTCGYAARRWRCGCRSRALSGAATWEDRRGF